MSVLYLWLIMMAMMVVDVATVAPEEICGIRRDETKSPWIVYITSINNNNNNNTLKCKAALISENYVIASYDCLNVKNGDENIFVKDNVVLIPFANKTIQLVKYVPNESANIALLEIKTIRSFDENVNKICLSKNVKHSRLYLHSADGAITGFSSEKYENNSYILRDDAMRRCNGILVKELSSKSPTQWILVGIPGDRCIFTELSGPVVTWIFENAK